ncbi:MAG: hypothetical protein F9K48_09605 [Candidatus Brocadia sp.]|nr:MAG: hypothetical protein F9K48_09605 [Candidatus Brocadia sp.]
MIKTRYEPVFLHEANVSIYSMCSTSAHIPQHAPERTVSDAYRYRSGKTTAPGVKGFRKGEA